MDSNVAPLEALAPVAECPPVAPAVAGVGLGSGGGPLPGLTGECGMGLGGRRGGPDILFEAVEEKPGIGGGGFLGGELGTPCSMSGTLAVAAPCRNGFEANGLVSLNDLLGGLFVAAVLKS